MHTEHWPRWARRWALEVSSDPACNDSGLRNGSNCWCNMRSCAELREGDAKNKNRDCWTQIFPSTPNTFYTREDEGIFLSSSNPQETLEWDLPGVSGRYVRLYIDQGRDISWQRNAVQCNNCYSEDDFYILYEISFKGKKADSCEQDISPPTSCPS